MVGTVMTTPSPLLFDEPADPLEEAPLLLEARSSVTELVSPCCEGRFGSGALACPFADELQHEMRRASATCHCGEAVNP